MLQRISTLTILAAVLAGGAAPDGHAQQADDFGAATGGFETEIRPADPMGIDGADSAGPPAGGGSRGGGIAGDERGSGNAGEERPLVTGSLPPARPPLPDPVPSRDPYAALGIRAGSLILFPEIGLGGQYSDNVSTTDGSEGDGDIALIMAPRLRVISDWMRHALSLDARSEHEIYTGSNSEDVHSVDLTGTARIDVRERTRLDLAGSYGFGNDDRGDADIPDAASEVPDVHELRGRAEVTQRFNRMSVALRGAVERFLHEDAQLVGGGIESNADRDYVELSGRLRLGYAFSPALGVFTEGGLAERVHDQEIDDNGERRDSTGYVVAGGARLEMTPVTQAELALGYLSTEFDDPTLSAIDDIFFRADVTWKPSALTTVTLKAATGVDETTLAGASGSVERSLSLDIRHAFRDNLIASAKAEYTHADFEGSPLVEQRLVLTLAAEYRLNRWAAFVARYSFEDFSDNEAGGDFSENALFLGLNLRR